MMKTINERRVCYYDLLNVLACFSVVLLHQNYKVWQFEYSCEWIGSVIIECLCYWAVPVFFMLSGATLIGYEMRYSTKVFFRKRFLRTGFPFCVFSIIAFIISYKKFEDVELPILIMNFLDAKIYHLYWFFIPLFWLYLLMPVLTSFRKLNIKSQKYLLIILLCIVSLPLVNQITSHVFSYSTNELAGPILYALLGFYIANNEISRRAKLVLCSLGLLSAVLRGYFMIKMSFDNGTIQTSLTNYFYPTTFSMGGAFFLCAKNINVSKSFSVYLSELSKLSLGIYLIHCFVINGEHMFVGNIDDNFIKAFFVSFLTYFISAAVVYLVKKIPYLNYIFP